MEIFLSEETSDSNVSAVEVILDSLAGVNSVEFISRERARQELNRLIGVDLLVGYDTVNPLPRSFVLDFQPQYLTTAKMAAIESEIEKIPEISHIYYSRQWLQKAESTRSTFLNFGMALGGLILLTALISTITSIQFMTQTRATGFQQMRLLGAGRLFLTLPLFIESFLITVLSAVTGWVLIWYARQQITFTQFELVIPTIEEILIFCGAAGLVGIISGYLGVRKVLR